MPHRLAILAKRKAAQKGWNVKPELVQSGFGYSPESIILAEYHLQRLNLIKINKKLYATRQGETYFSTAIKIALEIKDNIYVYRYDRGTTLGASMYALIDWKSNFHSTQEYLSYLHSITKEMNILKSTWSRGYRYYLSLILRYHFETMTDPLSLLRKILKLRNEIESLL